MQNNILAVQNLYLAFDFMATSNEALEPCM
jgi:hypothetical protein